MLSVAAVLAGFGGMPQVATAILIVIVCNGLFAFVQEYRADRAAAKLADFLPAGVHLARDGAGRIISAAELVTEDVVTLESGDRDCADVRLEYAESLTMSRC